MAVDLGTTTRSTTYSPIMSISTPLRENNVSFVNAKGLTNRPGQNNCFLNSSIQVLWHLDAFRRSFRDLTGHACLAESCIFCALKELFSELQHSRAKALPPDSLRKALADSFLDQQKFQIGFMDDAAECFENMLLRIHDHIAHKEPEDACSAPHCISHQKFAMNLVEQSVCGSCGATTDPMSFTQMVQYVSTSTLVHQLRLSIGQTGRSDKFGRLLHKASNMGDARQCPASCGSVTQMCRILMNRPEIVSIGLVWNSEKPTLEHIMEVFSCIDTTLRLSDVFSTVTDGRWAESTTHNLVGVVTYYGKHYSTFFFHTKLKEWIFLDDATVRDVGPRWEQVVEKCRKGKFQPLLLLYATPISTPVNLEYAPKINTPFYTDKTRHQQLLRRSITPSPEKPIIGNTRRAITPNPENSSMMMNQKPPLANKTYNDYQNLSIIQKNIDSKGTSTDQLDGCIIPKSPEYVTRKFMENNGKPQVNIHRTLSNGSSSGVESGVSIPDHLNVPRRRDSGNWSGDRNSASSASSTTMDYQYSYFIGKTAPHGSLPGSPTRVKSESNNNNNNINNNNNGTFDAGYDSYSLSSNDSSNNNNMTTIQHLMKSGHLAQIPEDYSNTPLANGSQSCDVLCDEAEELLVKSRQLEAAHDLVLALALCNAAATRARAAMNAPYNNPQTLTLARMKHNTCIMRAKSLHRRMIQNQPQNKENNGMEIRHTREGSSGSGGRHSRQNSRDKGQHSRQSSRELLQQQEKEKAKPIKNIEIYATLPKKKDNLKTKMNVAVNIEDEEYMLYAKAPPERESRSIFSRSNKNKELKVKEKRSRSEDRNKITKGSDFSIAPEIIVLGKDTLKKDKEKEEKKDKEGKNKKQHKIRRKLLMGGLIRRKNRSMPDLTDSTNEENNQQIIISVDEGRKTPEQPVQAGINGYLSEGHLEFSGANPNPNLERSKLMRKSFHGSAGKILTAAKVPPPPPLRTTSQLSRSKSNVSSEDDNKNNGGEQCQFNIYGDSNNIYHNLSDFNQSNNEEQSSMSLPYYGNSNGNSFDDDSSFPNLSSGSNVVITRADVHRGKDESPIIMPDEDVDEVDCMPAHHHLISMLELPPYPSPSGSAIHSRQASEDFPPPPPPLDLSALEEHLPKVESEPEPNSLLAQLQNKRRQILTHENVQLTKANNLRSTGETWLKELQAKQAALKTKKNKELNGGENGVDEINTQRYLPGDGLVIKSVKDLASKFENTEIPHIVKQPSTKAIVQKSSSISTIAPEQVEKEIREVAMLSSEVNKAFGNNNNNQNNNNMLENSLKIRPLKKKSVSFCDEVILVSTAEEQEEDTYIPNPILERVLRTAANSAEANSIRQELISLCENNTSKNIPSPVQQNMMMQPEQQYVRRNSLDLLNNNNNNGPRYPTPNNDPQYCAYREEKMQQNYQPQNVQFDYNNQMHPQMQQTQWTPVPPIQQPHFANQDIYNRNIQSYEYPGTTTAPGLYPAENLQHVNHYGAVQNGYPRQISPYQPIPQNSVIHPSSGYYRNSPTNNGHHQMMPTRNVPNQNYLYAPSTRPPQHQYQIHNNNNNNINSRHSSPGFITPSPVPSSVSSCNNYPQEVYRNSPQTVYQRIPPPPPPLTNGEYHHHQQNNYDIQHEVYQRIPPLHAEEPIYPRNTTKYVQYQRVPSPNNNNNNKLLLSKKTDNSFQPGSKGYTEVPQIPKAIVTPIVVNNANNSIPTDKTKCSLCRKKSVAAQNLYCKGCEVYIARLTPKT